MVNTVQSTNCSLIASWMMLSVLQTGGEGRGEEGRGGEGRGGRVINTGRTCGILCHQS